MCEAAGVEYMSCSADESRKTCSEFPTAVNGNGNAVCGVSDLPGTGCSAGKTFQEALSLCVGAGARLCTLQEVLDNEVRLSGCNNFEAARVWTSTREECPQDHVKTTGDHDARTSATRRPACTPITESFNMAVRCCADVEHLCEAGLPCHPRGSLLTCSELNWEQVGNLGRGIADYGSDSSDVCGESDAMTGECASVATVDFETAANACMGVGARLCTLAELLVNEGVHTGCNFDDNMTWTSTQHGCRPGQVNTIIGSAEFRGSDRCIRGAEPGTATGSPCPAGPVCTDMQSRSASARCCADAERKCFSEGDALPSLEAADQQWMQCTADESLKTCDELGWEMTVVYSDNGWVNPMAGTDSVCANSKVGPPTAEHPEGSCSRSSTFTEALSLCVNAFARLCTLQEILNHEAAGSGCWLGSQRVWTSAREECGASEAKTVAGGASVDVDDAVANFALNPPACTPMSEPHGVRCCADNLRRCPAGTPCHPKASLLTCAELQAVSEGNFASGNTHSATDTFGEANVCAETQITGAGCQTSAGYYTAANTCMGVGARLCTADELVRNEAANTGCQANVFRAWSSSAGTCGSGHVLTVMGSTTFSSNPPVCASMLSGTAAVRCCADVERQCFDEASHASPLKKFRAFPHHAIGGHNIWCSDGAGHAMTSEYCAIECLRHDNCVSFQLRASDGRCCIQDETRASVGCTQTACSGGQSYHIDVQYTYYEKISASDSFGCTADESLHTCSELGWMAKDSPNVCSNTEFPADHNLRGTHQTSGAWGGLAQVNATFVQALAMCVEAGARLCTLAEVMDERTAAINAVTNHHRVWTSTRDECGTNQGS